MGIVLSFVHIIYLSFIEMLYFVGVFIIVGFILGVFERYSNTFLVRTFGPKGVLLTAWIGTPIHEIGHLLQCFIWGHRVTRVKLLQLNNPYGELGFVEHQYNLNSVYQRIGNFFIGIGPIFSGIGMLIFGIYLFLPQSFAAFKNEIHQHVSFEVVNPAVLKGIGVTIMVMVKSLFTFHNLINPLFWVFLIAAISISSHIALSKSDIQSSANGLATIFIVLVLINCLAAFFHINSYQMVLKFTEYNAYVIAFSSIALVFSLLMLVLSFILYKVKGMIKN